jgi:hypothetical protein
MSLGTDFQLYREGDWTLVVRSQMWSQDLWAEVLRHLTAEVPTHHPQIKRIYLPPDGGDRVFYLKIYYPSGPQGMIKDLFRSSKAIRALKQGEALVKNGFHAPLAAAAGEERKLRFVRKAFLLTTGIEGTSLRLFLKERCSYPLDSTLLKQKRKSLEQLALEIRRLHQCGFVHGELTPSNIMLQRREKEITFFFMDNDRTKRYPRWCPHVFWKRNLLQLNRFVLSHISLQDRVRFLRSYLGVGVWGRKERQLARWLEQNTRRRRLECDGVEAPVSFRELMRWNGPFGGDA